MRSPERDNTRARFQRRVFGWAWRTLEREAGCGFPSFKKVGSPWWTFWAGKLGSLPMETRLGVLRMLLRKRYPQEAAELWEQPWTAEDDLAFARYEEQRRQWWTEQRYGSDALAVQPDEGPIRRAELKRRLSDVIANGGSQPGRPRYEGFLGWDVDVEGWIVHSYFVFSPTRVLELYHAILSGNEGMLVPGDKLGWPLGLGSMSDWDDVTSSSADRVIEGAMFCAEWYLSGCREWLSGLVMEQ